MIKSRSYLSSASACRIRSEVASQGEGAPGMVSFCDLPVKRRLGIVTIHSFSKHDVLLRQVVLQQAERKTMERPCPVALHSGNQTLGDFQARCIHEADRRILDKEPQMGSVQNTRIPIGKLALEQKRNGNTEMRDIWYGHHDVTTRLEQPSHVLQ